MQRTKEELEILFSNFDRHMADYSRLFRFLLAVDQLFNVIIFNGSPDETISSHIHRRQLNGTATWLDKKVCCLLKKLESEHCLKSLGE